MCVLLCICTFFSASTSSMANIMTGFIDGFTNAMGRLATFDILSMVFAEPVSVRNLGGNSRHNRELHFQFDVMVPYMSTSEDSSPEKSTASTSQRNMETVSTTTEQQYFRPDLVVGQLEFSNDDKPTFHELMVVEVKSNVFTHHDFLQIRYELMPLLFQQNRAWGLLINSQCAVLMKLEVVDEDEQKKMMHFAK